MTLREGFPFGDNDDDDDKKKTKEEKEQEMIKEINDAFDPDDFRVKVKKLLDLYKEIEKTQGKAYIFSMVDRTYMRDIDYLKSLWDEEEDEWKEKAYSEKAESKLKKYNLTMFYTANIFDEIFEKAETKESYKKKYDNMKEHYGKTGITYIKRIISIVLDKDMADLDMDTNLGQKSNGSFF
tara:strand:- start:299 stop:841 length:543 start_codon:yes stop_codon:yes gene_type:complete